MGTTTVTEHTRNEPAMLLAQGTFNAKDIQWTPMVAERGSILLWTFVPDLVNLFSGTNVYNNQ